MEKYRGKVVGATNAYKLIIAKEDQHPSGRSTDVTYLPDIYLCGEGVTEDFARKVRDLYIKEITK